MNLISSPHNFSSLSLPFGGRGGGRRRRAGGTRRRATRNGQQWPINGGNEPRSDIIAIGYNKGQIKYTVRII